MNRTFISFLLLCFAQFAVGEYLTDSNLYTFDASSQTITLSNADLDLVVSITNNTDQVQIYRLGDADNGGSESSGVISLDYNTTNMSDGDLLIIEYQQIPGMCPWPINKFGRQTNADSGVPTDVHDSTTNLIWDAPNAARIHAIVSASDEDSDSGGSVAQGTGARTISVCGLLLWTSASQSCETVIMDGTTAVNTASAYVIIHRMYVLTYAAGGPNTGAITATAAVDASITATIKAGAGQTQMAIYGIPSTQTFYINQVYGTLLSATPAATNTDFVVWVNTGVASWQDDYIVKHPDGIASTGSSHAHHVFNPPKVIPGPAIIKIQVTTTKDDADIQAGFEGCLRTI